jgi:IS605 OrfB family transposase
LLLATLERFNEACDWLGGEAFAAKCADEHTLQLARYRELRERFSLSSQMAIRVIGKVCDAYRRDRSIQPTFRPHGAIPYDQRIYSVSAKVDLLSILTLDGRVKTPFVAGDHQWEMLKYPCGQADLVLDAGVWYLYVGVEVPDQFGPPNILGGILGVDLGIVNIATDSDGMRYSGADVEAKRIAIQKLRSDLQRADTKSAKRHLRKLARKESRFRSHTNHVIAKNLVAKAKDTDRGIAIEDLDGIRDRTTVRRDQRARFGAWAFFQLRSYLTYKAHRACVLLVLVDPRNTSRTCPECGYCDKRNRRSQSVFVCKSCGFVGHADEVGARNIARRGSVNSPIVSIDDSGNGDYHLVPPMPRRDQGQSPSL